MVVVRCVPVAPNLIYVIGILGRAALAQVLLVAGRRGASPAQVYSCLFAQPAQPAKSLALVWVALELPKWRPANQRHHHY